MNHEFDMQVNLPHGYVFTVTHECRDGKNIRILTWVDDNRNVVLTRKIDTGVVVRHLGLREIERAYLEEFYKNPWVAKHSQKLPMMVNNTYRYLTHNSLVVRHSETHFRFKTVQVHDGYSINTEYRFYKTTGVMVGHYTFSRGRTEGLESQLIRHDSPDMLTITRHITREHGVVPTLGEIIADNKALIDVFYAN